MRVHRYPLFIFLSPPYFCPSLCNHFWGSPMPIETAIPLRHHSQDEFGKVAYEVVGKAFEVHQRLGRMFRESVYRSTSKHLLGSRAVEEVGVRLIHKGYEKELSMDLVVDRGCPFELKVAAQLTNKHRGQLIQYLMLTDLSHGKLINFGTDRLEHEFVNCHETTAQRRSFEIERIDWSDSDEDATRLESLVIDLLRDWGTGLDPSLYHDAVVYQLGGFDSVRRAIGTHWEGTALGKQEISLLRSRAAFKITCTRGDLTVNEDHLLRFLSNVDLDSIYWVNVVSGVVRFQTVGSECGQKNVGTKR